MSTDKKQTLISELGEFGFIDRLTKGFKNYKDDKTIGIGEDAAVLSNGTVISTDSLMEGVDFDLTYFPLKHLGYKSVIAGIADIYAMGATPKQIMLSLGISGKFSVEAIEEIYSGVKIACDTYKLDLIGGDTNASMTGLVINITSIGELNDKEAIKRSGAKVNDLICVSGNLGASYMGINILERENKLFQDNPEIQPQLQNYDYILKRYMKPEIATKVLESLEKKNITPNAMIDISDGLASELLHICKSSNTGCKVFLDKLPIDDETHKVAQELNMDAFTCAMNGGDDYEMLFTIPVDDYEKLIDISGLSIIGHITNDPHAVLVTPDGNEVEIKAQGWK